jgi:DNA-binding LytR/AlgR family response regulator
LLEILDAPVIVKEEVKEMIRVAIVEDEQEVQTQLEGYLQKYGREYGEKFDILFFSDGEEIIEKYQAEYDIIFLDIQMKRMNGMETAKRIRRMDQEVTLVFITNMANYAIHGYSVEATSFILKPVQYFTFHEELNKIKERLKKHKKLYITFQIDGGFIRLEVMELYYIESFGHRLILHSRNGDYTMIGTMKSMEKQLENYDFFRCNNSYIVNLAHVEGVQQNIVTVAGQELQVSRPKKKAFMDALADYIGGIFR